MPCGLRLPARLSRATEPECRGKVWQSAEKSKHDPISEIHRTLNKACRKWVVRAIRLRCLPNVTQSLDSRGRDLSSPRHREDPRRYSGWRNCLAGHREL
jgi:hypothetical protein